MGKFREIRNDKAGFDYHIVDTYQAGMMLSADLVKKIAHNQFSLSGNYVRLVNGEVFLLSDSANESIKLLLNKREVNVLIGRVQPEGMTMVPLSISLVRGKFKLNFALAKGKKKHDKREADKNRAVDLENRRIIKSQKMLD